MVSDRRTLNTRELSDATTFDGPCDWKWRIHVLSDVYIGPHRSRRLVPTSSSRPTHEWASHSLSLASSSDSTLGALPKDPDFLSPPKEGNRRGYTGRAARADEVIEDGEERETGKRRGGLRGFGSRRTWATEMRRLCNDLERKPRIVSRKLTSVSSMRTSSVSNRGPSSQSQVENQGN